MFVFVFFNVLAYVTTNAPDYFESPISFRELSWKAVVSVDKERIGMNSDLLGF